MGLFSPSRVTCDRNLLLNHALYQQRVAQLPGRIVVARGELAAAENREGDADRAVTLREGAQRGLRSKLTVQERRKISAEGQLEQAQTMFSQLITEISAESARQTGLEQDLQGLRRERATLEAELARLQADQLPPPKAPDPDPAPDPAPAPPSPPGAVNVTGTQLDDMPPATNRQAPLNRDRDQDRSRAPLEFTADDLRRASPEELLRLQRLAAEGGGQISPESLRLMEEAGLLPAQVQDRPPAQTLGVLRAPGAGGKLGAALIALLLVLIAASLFQRRGA